MPSRSRGLIDGGADLLLIETIFDTLNAKAAICAIAEVTEARGAQRAGDDLRHHHRPLRAAPVRPDAGGVLEFGAPRRAVLDRAQLRARRQGDARAHRRDRRASPIRSSAPIPMPACPTNSAATTRAPNSWPSLLGEFADAGLVNIVGGCCGTTPEHIRAIAARGRGQGAARGPRGAAAAAALRPRGVHAHAGNPVRQRRRAHQRHRLGASSASSSPPATTPRRSRSRATRSRTARRSSTSTWTRACSIPRRRW